MLDQAAKSGLTLPQRLFRLFPVRHVNNECERPDDLPLLIALEDGAQQHVDHLSVLLDHLVFKVLRHTRFKESG